MNIEMRELLNFFVYSLFAVFGLAIWVGLWVLCMTATDSPHGIHRFFGTVGALVLVSAALAFLGAGFSHVL